MKSGAPGPGSINTPFSRRYLDGLDDPIAREAEIEAAHPMGRRAEPKEIAGPILFLLGVESSFVAGQVLRVGGGYPAR